MAAVSLFAITLAVLYWFPLRKWFGRWGTTCTDLTRIMSGDAAVVDPTYRATLAVTVEAKSADIWPWLVQSRHAA